MSNSTPNKVKTILLAHGSSDPDWSNAFVKMTQDATKGNHDAALAFMELSEPSLEAEVKLASQDGYTEAQVLPLFLAQGRHLKKDVPAMLAEYEEKYSIQTKLLPPIGEHPILSKAIDAIISEST